MNNIINFPLERRETQKQEEQEVAEFLVSESGEITAFILDEIDNLMDEISEQGEHDHFDGFDFRVEDNHESKDMFVLANLMNSMFLRFYGIEHTLHNELDELYNTISEMHKNNDIT